MRVGLVCGMGAGRISQTPAGLVQILQVRTKNFNPCRTLAATVARDNLPLEYASELFEPSKDS